MGLDTQSTWSVSTENVKVSKQKTVQLQNKFSIELHVAAKKDVTMLVGAEKLGSRVGVTGDTNLPYAEANKQQTF